MTSRIFHPGIAVLAVAAFLAAARPSTQQLIGETVRVGKDDIGGVVSSAKGPEAGVWVIAETADLPTKFVKIVVTDERGRYLVPELPKANYKIWVRATGS